MDEAGEGWAQEPTLRAAPGEVPPVRKGAHPPGHSPVLSPLSSAPWRRGSSRYGDRSVLPPPPAPVPSHTVSLGMLPPHPIRLAGVTAPVRGEAGAGEGQGPAPRSGYRPGQAREGKVSDRDADLGNTLRSACALRRVRSSHGHLTNNSHTVLVRTRLS